jgi:hypothetical protein
MTMRWKLWLAPAAIVAAALASVPAAGLYYQSSWGLGCARCHEIGIDYDMWHRSSHRNINCVECHSSSLGTDVRRVLAHWKGEVPEQVHLRTEDVFAMLPQCRKCHQQEFAQWSSGAHSTTYARLFTDPEQNRKRLLVDDCLRCHGMHFEGGIQEIVQPIDTAGPWRLKDPAYTNRPAIPCLACHSIHRTGETLTRARQRIGAREEIVRPSVGFFDRRSRLNVSAGNLPIPAVFEGPRPVKMSPDERQSICYQCHAPLADRQVGGGDDRTPIGVHEGLSCLACHQKHGQTTRQSCADCHPRLSDCGIDVDKMDTTFLNPKSGHDVHWVKCVDCHPKGIPKKKPDSPQSRRDAE